MSTTGTPTAEPARCMRGGRVPRVSEAERIAALIAEAAHAGCRDYLGAYSSAHAAGECRPYREMARAAGTPEEDK